LASLYLDHNLAREVARILRLESHDVRSFREIHTERVTDDEQLALAYENNWIFITHNVRDFTLLHSAWRRWSRLWGVDVLHPGIIALEPVPDALQIASLVDERLRSGARVVGELAVWRPHGGWR
jgi:hypothetical protein